jgi:hypothetical protein
MIANDLLRTDGPLPSVGVSNMDPFAEEGLFAEAQLMEAKFDASRAVLGLLIDLRPAFQFDAGNTCVLVAYGVTALHWDSEQRQTKRTAWNILGSELTAAQHGFALSMGCYPDAKLLVVAESFSYFNCLSVDLPEHGPDYTQDEAMVLPSIPTWESNIELLGRLDYSRQS